MGRGMALHQRTHVTVQSMHPQLGPHRRRQPTAGEGALSAGDASHTTHHHSAQTKVAFSGSHALSYHANACQACDATAKSPRGGASPWGGAAWGAGAGAGRFTIPIFIFLLFLDAILDLRAVWVCFWPSTCTANVRQPEPSAALHVTPPNARCKHAQ